MIAIDSGMQHGTCVMHMPCPSNHACQYCIQSAWKKWPTIWHADVSDGLHSAFVDIVVPSIRSACATQRRMCNPQFYVSGKRPMEHWDMELEAVLVRMTIWYFTNFYVFGLVFALILGSWQPPNVAGVGVTKAPFVNFSVNKIFGLAKVHVRFLESHSYAVMHWQVFPQLSCGDTCQI